MHSLLMTVLLMLFATLVGAVGSVYLKKGAAKFHVSLKQGLLRPISDLLKNTNIITGVILYLLGTILFLYLLRSQELSVLYPMTSLSYIFVAIFSAFILKERINAYKLIGISLIIFGVVLVTL